MSVTCDRFVDFSGYSNFRHKSSKWNIFESGVKHLTSNGQMMDQTPVYVVHNIKHLWVIMWELSVGLCPYLLLLDQTILLHFRSSIDRPLNGYLRIPVVITISVSRKKIYNQSLGAYEKKTILDEVVFILFLSYICIWLLRADIPSFFTAKIASQISKRHLSAWNIWTFFRRFSRNFNTSWNQKKIL